MLWNELIPLVENRVFWLGPPDVLLLQLGGNDLPRMDCRTLRWLIHNNLWTLGACLPDTILVWSHLLQRFFWRGARSPAAVERARKRVNGLAVQTVRALGGWDIPHPGITIQSASLFRRDGVHLSPEGNDLCWRQ